MTFFCIFYLLDKKKAGVNNRVQAPSLPEQRHSSGAAAKKVQSAGDPSATKRGKRQKFPAKTPYILVYPAQSI
jgi:hypothetical protein